MQKPAIFLDRDGTLIEEVNYLSRIEDLRFFSFTEEAVSLLKKSGYLLIVITNQSGIGRGIFDETAVHSIHDEIQRRLNNQIDAFYFCPHLPCDGCTCRKPEPGMIEVALTDFEIDMQNSWIIGDKLLDIETGFNAGIKTAMVLTGYGASHSKRLTRKPDLLEKNLLDAVIRIVSVART